MKITRIDATHVGVNNVSHVLTDLTIIVTAKWYRVIDTESGDDIVGKTYFFNAWNEAQVATPSITYAAVVAEITGALGLSPNGQSVGAFVANTAAAQSVAYVQADVQSILTELRAVKASLVSAGVLAAS